MTTTNPARDARVPTRLGELAVRCFEPASADDRPAGPPVILWSSMFVDGHTFDRLVPLLPTRRMLVVDAPGLGGSRPLERVSSIKEAADAAVDLLTGPAAAELGIDGPVDWLGNALGGHIGYALATRRGLLRSLVSVSAPFEPIPAELRRQIRLLGPLLRTVGAVGPVRSAIMAAMLTEQSAADPGIRPIVLDALARPTRRSLSLAVKSFILERSDVTATLPELALPCLFVAGDDRGDWSPADAQRAAAAAPDATAVTVSRARTLIPLEQPEALAAEILAFWSRLDVGAHPSSRQKRRPQVLTHERDVATDEPAAP